MSSLHQDRLLAEGSGPVTGTASTLPSGRGSRRRTAGTTEKQATRTLPTRRQGTAQQTGTTTSTATADKASSPRASGAKAATSGSLAARAKAATVKAASTKAATAKAATAKAATAARAAAVTRVANRTASVRVARANAAATPAAAPAANSAATKAAKPAATTTAQPVAAEPATATKTTTAKAATAKAGTTSKPAAAESAAAKPSTAKGGTAKASTAKGGTAKATTAKGGTAKATTAKASTAKATTAKAASTKASAAKAEPAEPVVKAPRPTPYKRATAGAAAPVLVPVIDVADLLAEEAPEAVVVRKDLPAGTATVADRLPRFLRRRAPMLHRRSALYVAAALIGSLSVTTVTTAGPEARATATVSHSVSVAEQLGIETTHPSVGITTDVATERLGELAASRNVRDDEQAAAAQAQAEADRAAAEAAAEAARPKAVFPVPGARLTSTFGPRWGTLHAGIDLAAPMLTPEFAVMDGVVLEAGPASGYGNVIYIQHENGDVTVYGHMEKILVSAGQVVRAGDTIALLGNRGQSTGPHLHFEVHVGGMNGTKVDPLPWLRERGVGI